MGFLVARASVAALIVLLGLLANIVPNAPVQAQGISCADIGVYEYAQSLFDADPAVWAALDPDGDGVACPELPNGVAPALWTDAVPSDATPATVLRVVDGDTIEAEVGGVVERVRLILVDTPETKDPNNPVECYGAEATSFTTWLLGLGAPLYLETDVSDRDRYDRLLRYAWLDFGNGSVVQVNEAIVRSGYGVLATFPPDVEYVEEMRDAQAFARRHQLGLWPACGGADTPLGIVAEPAPAPASTSGIASSGGGADGGSCDPSYPNFCIPPGSPDLDCGDIPQRRFTVLPPDPHRFDGDKDGIGCES